MYHVILIALALTLMLSWWNLVHASPRSIAMVLSPGVAFIIGTFFLCFGVFFAFISAYPLQEGGAMIAFFLKAFVGVWFLLAHLRGNEVIVRQAFLMMGSIVFTFTAIYYLQDPRATALLTLIMVAGGYWLAMNHERFLNRGR